MGLFLILIDGAASSRRGYADVEPGDSSLLLTIREFQG